MFAFANIAFFAFHTCLILFNVLGWIWQRTRRWNLGTLLATFVSWFVLGMWKGVGYCICTDWHFQVREAMGIHDRADSYLVLLIQKLSGWNPPVGLVNACAAVVFLSSLAASLALNLRDFRRNRTLPLHAAGSSEVPPHAS